MNEANSGVDKKEIISQWLIISSIEIIKLKIQSFYKAKNP